jgi:hypothetical protein
LKRASAVRLLLAAGLTSPLAACGEQNTMVVPHVNPFPQSRTAFGAQLYPGDDVQRALAMIAGIGGTTVRCATDNLPSDTALLDALVPAASARGMRVVIVTGTASQPIPLTSYIAHYVALQQRYAAYAPIWEIWNEPNLAFYWGATPNVDDYSRLALVVAHALRSAGATDVWTGGTSGLDAGWTYGLVRNGVFPTLNGCGVHSYEPVGAALDHYLQVRSLLPSGILLRTTETGVPTYADQVDFLTGMWYIHRQLSLPTMIWVEFRDGTAGEGADGYPYGLVTADYTPKLEYYTAQQLVNSAN